MNTGYTGHALAQQQWTEYATLRVEGEFLPVAEGEEELTVPPAAAVAMGDFCLYARVSRDLSTVPRMSKFASTCSSSGLHPDPTTVTPPFGGAHPGER